MGRKNSRNITFVIEKKNVLNKTRKINVNDKNINYKLLTISKMLDNSSIF